MIPTPHEHCGQAADVVPELLPPQIPAILLGAGRQSFSYPPAASSANAGAASQPFWRQQGSGQQVDYAAQQQQQLQHNGTQQLQQASSRVSNNTSSRRHVPTASGSSPGPSSSSSHAGRAPIDIVLRGLAGGGIGAGIGGMVRLQDPSCGTLLTPCSLVGSPPAAIALCQPSWQPPRSWQAILLASYI